ncbi:DUF167 domain-containing protein [Candidatus Woesearchaeota archaeon]|nr:DUF167 domain-containing protein [Candidatus Woesearchaeota archaeon]
MTDLAADAIAVIKDSTTITVVVKPNSSKNDIACYDSEKKAWIIKIKAAAEKDKANIELLNFLRKATGVRFAIKNGIHSRKKTLIATSS